MIYLEGRALSTCILILTSLGFLLIGYDNGLLGGLVGGNAFNNTFHNPSATIVGLIVAIYEVGCFLGSLTTSFCGESLGRKKTIGIGAVIMIVGAVLQSTAYARSHMIVARIVSGVGMGFINSTVPVYQSEFSPKGQRGLFVCMQLSTLNFGIFLAYWIDYAFASHSQSYAWRVPCILQCIFLVPMLGLLAVLPETPRWLASHGRTEESLIILERLHRNTTSAMTPAAIRDIHADIVRTVTLQKALGAGKWSDLLRNDNIQSQRRFLIACAVQIFQQLGGINAIIYYSGTLFEKSIGLDKHMAALMAGFLQTWFFLASFIPWVLIDRIGRRPLFLSMITLMASVMVVQTALIYQVQFHTSVAHAAAIGAVAMLFIFQGAFTIGFQATVWVYPTEILPLRLRQRGSSVSTACNWIFNFMVVQITPVAIQNIGYRTYIIFAVFNFLWVPIIYFFFPETKGLELEDVDRLFARGETQIELRLEDSFRRDPTLLQGKYNGRISQQYEEV